jgi:hypothetical protein
MLGERVLSAARHRGAEAALAGVPQAVMSMDEIGPTGIERLIVAPPELTRCCDADSSLHALRKDIIGADVLASATREELAAVDAVLVAAWEEGRDAVWDPAIKAAALRLAGFVDEALAIERTNEKYVDSIRADLVDTRRPKQSAHPGFLHRLGSK